MTTSPLTPAQPTKLREEFIRRLMLGLFAFLCTICFSVIVRPNTEGHIYLILLCLFEVPVMVIIALASGNNNITRDLNELNFYGLICHLIYLPFYFQGVPSVYHNTAIKILLVVFAIRLCYFGPRTADGDFKGLPIYGLLGYTRQWLAARRAAMDTSFQHWAAVLFFGSAVPLWLFMLYFNDLRVTASIAGLMVFIFFISNYLHALQTRTAPVQRQTIAIVPQPSPLPALPDAATAPDELPLVSVRDVAAQLLDAYKRTHPMAQNINVAVAIHLGRAFPSDASLVNPQSLSARRQQWLKQIVALAQLAKDQMVRKQKVNLEWNDISRLTNSFEASFKMDLSGDGLKLFMQYVMSFEPYGLTDTTMLLGCEVLVTAWLRVLLYANDVYMEEYDALEMVSNAFVRKFSPYYPEQK
jgi:hypothetical protein